MRILLACAALLTAGSAAAIDCSAPAPASAAAPAPLVAPLDPSMMQPAALVAVDPLTAGTDASMSVDAVLTRMRAEQCARPVKDAFAGYQKRTEFDDAPYRFNMKPGQKLSAAEFDAWMASRGIRIVKAKPAPTTTAEQVAPTAAN